MRKINHTNFLSKKTKEKQNKAICSILKLHTQRKFKSLRNKAEHLEPKQTETIKSEKNANKCDRAANNHERHINERINKLKLHNQIVQQRLVKNKENIRPENDKENENNLIIPKKIIKDEDEVNNSNSVCVLKNKINKINIVNDDSKKDENSIVAEKTQANKVFGSTNTPYYENLRNWCNNKK